MEILSYLIAIAIFGGVGYYIYKNRNNGGGGGTSAGRTNTHNQRR